MRARLRRFFGAAARRAAHGRGAAPIVQGLAAEPLPGQAAVAYRAMVPLWMWRHCALLPNPALSADRRDGAPPPPR